jgi:hypothetical protein
MWRGVTVIPPRNKLAELKRGEGAAISTKISKELLERIKEIAKATDRDQSDTVRFLLVAGVEQWDREQGER